MSEVERRTFDKLTGDKLAATLGKQGVASGLIMTDGPSKPDAAFQVHLTLSTVHSLYNSIFFCCKHFYSLLVGS
jgi:hypothetical protein